MVRWHHRLNGQEPEQTGASGGQRSLVCCSPQGGRQQLGTTRTQLTDWTTDNAGSVSHSVASDSVTPWIIARQAPLFMVFSIQARVLEWFAMPFSRGIFSRESLTQGSKPGLLHCRQIPYHPRHQGSQRLGNWMQGKDQDPGLRPHPRCDTWAGAGPPRSLRTHQERLSALVSVNQG